MVVVCVVKMKAKQEQERGPAGACLAEVAALVFGEAALDLWIFLIRRRICVGITNWFRGKKGHVEIESLFPRFFRSKRFSYLWIQKVFVSLL